MSKSRNEITELEVEEVTLEKQIDGTLTKHNVTDAVINGLKEKFGELRLRAIDDKESYLEVKEAKKEVRKWGILTEKLCKAGREEAVKVQKLWLSKEKEVLGKIAEVEDPLAAEMERYEKNIEALEQARIKKQDEAFINRQGTLSKMGATYGEGHFNLNDVSFELNIIKEADDDIWENSILPKYQIQYEKNEAIRVQQEKERAEQEEKMRKEREELERQQQELRNAQAELQRQKDEAEKERKELQQKKDAEEREARNILQNKRLTELLPLNPTGADVDMNSLWTLSEEKYAEILQAKQIEFKAQQEAKQKAIEEQAAEKERLRIEAEQRQEALKQQQAREQEQRELEAADDKTKWATWLNEFNAAITDLPNMKSGVYKSKVANAKRLIDEIVKL